MRVRQVQFIGLVLICAIFVGVIAISFDLLASPSELKDSTRIEISEWTETFSEDFRGHLDVTAWGPSRWIAHTPWNGDFGDARFVDPRPNFPFTTGPDGLTIEAKKRIDGKWESGLLSSRDAKKIGFEQAMGYFEIRTQLPPGPGVWPAFWLVSDADPERNAEIDVLEYYGQFPTRYSSTIHIWPKRASDNNTLHDTHRIEVADGSLITDFHTYGISIDKDWIVAYLDRIEVSRWVSRPEFQMPMYLLLNLALGSGWPIDKTPNPSIMRVDYVKAFVRR